MDDPIAQFLNFLAVEKNASPNTIAAYRNDLAQFLKFVSGSAAGNVGGSRLSKAAGETPGRHRMGAGHEPDARAGKLRVGQ